MIVAVGSDNPVKINATQRAFTDRLKESINIVHKKLPSGVSDQPIGDEIQTGARNRAVAVREKYDADFGVGLEGGGLQNIRINGWNMRGVLLLTERVPLPMAIRLESLCQTYL